VAGHTLKIAILDPGARGPRPDVEALRARIAERIDRAPPLRRKLEPRTGRGVAAAWVDDPAFDVRWHVRPLPTAAPVSDDQLRRIVARVMEERLDRSRPLWTIDVIDALEDGGLGLVWKIHHSMADGATAIRFAAEVLWDRSTAAGDRGRRVDRAEGAAARPFVGVREALIARRPGQLPPTLRRDLHRTRRRSPFDGAIGASRIVSFATLPLGTLRRAARVLVPGATVNDVLLALVAGGLRQWAEGPGDRCPTMRVKVPVSLHGGARSAEAANRDSFFVVPLPLDEPDPVERLRRVRAHTAVCKRARDPVVLDRLLRDLGYLPPLRRLMDRLLADPRAFAVNVSNVPGPVERPSVLGAPVRALYSIAEVGERHGLRVAVISMADELHFGLCADPGIVGDLDPFVTGIRAEALALLDRSRAAHPDGAPAT
jgi:WS/DGAT/MGAT family acyltransferase